MKEKLISKDQVRDFHPVFRGKYGDTFIKWGMKISGLDIVNEVYDKSKHLTGPAFCKDLLDKLGLKRTVVNAEILESFKDKPFITVSNHAYGHVDGIAAIETVGSRVAHYRMMVNAVLGLVDTMADNFITVNPFLEDKMSSVAGVKKALQHVKNGYPLGFFPAGAISDFVWKSGLPAIEDREWQASVIRIIQKSKVPVIPMHFSGGNSARYYLRRILGRNIRTLGLCRELANKRGKEMVITIGEPIMPDEITQYPDVKDLGNFLKSKTYALAKKK
ncbi:MAG: 1-acyl-sn-glycerol-3-phosphate acyltransferase [Dysgonamonadaceae bacterium]|jgi:putative hemolysin|nr:1-acyl-sn-glycerol-3-phosphate acyltransferase [Dysgonamonadaceae bacterium]